MKFDASAWMRREGSEAKLNAAVPDRPDNYRPGHGTMGADPKRSHAIQQGRRKRQHETNVRFLLETVLPKIEHELDPESWRSIANVVYERYDEFMRRGGYVLYALDVRSSWIHPELEPEKLKLAREMGATERKEAAK